MGAGASAGEARVFCHHCGARTASSSDGSLRCGSCGATEGVEATDQRLPMTGPTPVAALTAATLAGAVGSSSSSNSSALVTSAGAGILSSRLAGAPAGLGAAIASTQERSAMRVESVTVVATQRPEDGGLLLRVLPNVVARREAAATTVESEDFEATPEPACSAFVSRLEKSPLSAEAADNGNLCVICSEDLIEADLAVVPLACGHVFHDLCIKRWLTRRHTCPTCRFEMEVDNVKYLRSIGLADEADALEKVEQEKQAKELQKQAAARRRWVQSMRRGDPVHFGLVCGHCADTPLIGQCFRCTTCEGYILCSVCKTAHEADPSLGRHVQDHSFVEFGMGAGSANGTSGGVPHGPGGQLTVLLPAPARPAPIDTSPSSGQEAGDAPGEAALAAAEAAFVAVRSLALAPLAGAGGSLLLSPGASGGGASRAAAAAAAAAASASANGASRGMGLVRRAG